MVSDADTAHGASYIDEPPPQHIDLPDDWRGDIKRPFKELCPTCFWDGEWQRLLIRSWPDLGRVIAKPNLWSSASEGRICCAVILAFLQEVSGGKYECLSWDPSTGVLVAYEFEPQTDRICAMHKRNAPGRFLAIGSEPGPPGMLVIPPEEPPSIDTGSEASVAWAKHRLNECCHDHMHSHSLEFLRASDSYIPTRLLYIPADPSEGLILRLKENVPVGAKYVALSHCWGSRENWPGCLSTNTNYESQLKCVPWETIPQTFQDAAIFSRKLGFEYLWIDSMCIIQDNEKDWQNESTQMYSVYSNAHITLAALHANDSHGGLFSRRPPGSLFSLITAGFLGKRYQVQAYIPPNERRDIQSKLGIRETAVTSRSYPLLNRAWVFQERLVSPRMLFFGQEELIWECPTGLRCEEDPYSSALWSAGGGWGGQAVNPHGSLMQTYNTNPGGLVDLEALWFSLVESYSELKLSNPTDRLPAIAAIAQHFAQLSPGNDYICGLWKNTLHLGLGFEIIRDKKNSGPHIDTGRSLTSESRYTAPSWSWATAQRRVYKSNLAPLSSTRVELINADLGFLDNNQFGRVAPGSLITLRAPVLDCVWILTYEPNRSGGTLDELQYLDVPTPASGRTISVRFRSDYAFYGGLWQRDLVEVCLLLLGSRELGSSSLHAPKWYSSKSDALKLDALKSDALSFDALILKPIGKNGHYFRLGALIDIRDDSLMQAFTEAQLRECAIE